jgi:hypothetical protein
VDSSHPPRSTPSPSSSHKTPATHRRVPAAAPARPGLAQRQRKHPFGCRSAARLLVVQPSSQIRAVPATAQRGEEVSGSRLLAKTGEVAGLGREPPLSSSGEALRGSRWAGCPGCRPAPGNISGRVLRDATRFVGLENHLLAGSRSAGGRPRSSSRSRFRLRTGPRRSLGANTPRDAELRGDLACSRLGSERKYVKRIYARDTGKARRQFAR